MIYETRFVVLCCMTAGFFGWETLPHLTAWWLR